MKTKSKIDWNIDVVGKLSKSAFVKRFEKVFPGLDLSDEYDQLFPPKPRKKSGDKEGQEPES